jgi:hypothetical protein
LGSDTASAGSALALALAAGLSGTVGVLSEAAGSVGIEDDMGRVGVPPPRVRQRKAG